MDCLADAGDADLVSAALGGALEVSSPVKDAKIDDFVSKAAGLVSDFTAAVVGTAAALFAGAASEATDGVVFCLTDAGRGCFGVAELFGFDTTLAQLMSWRYTAYKVR
jgi:hypothetical protein